jgi:hypothetical protein
MKKLMLACLLAAACASSPQEPSLVEVDVRTGGSLFFGSGTTAPLMAEVVVGNRTSAPIVLRGIRLSSPGMSQYSLLPESRTFNDTIAAGEAKAYPMTPTAVASRARMTVNEPLTIRAEIDFESGGKRRREIVHVRNVGM